MDAKDHLDSIYPMRQTTMTSADPPFLTPETKSMLRKKNHLMRRGRVDEASASAKRIGIKIEGANKAHLRSIPPGAGKSELWCRVNEVIGKKGRMLINWV